MITSQAACTTLLSVMRAHSVCLVIVSLCSSPAWAAPPSKHLQTRPTVKLTWGKSKAPKTVRTDAIILGRQVHDGHTYLLATPAKKLDAGALTLRSQSPHAVAVASFADSIAVRVVGDHPGSGLRLTGENRQLRWEVRLKTVPNPAEWLAKNPRQAAYVPRPSDDLVQVVFGFIAMSRWDCRLVGCFARSRLRVLAGSAGQTSTGVTGGVRRTALGETMHLYTGMGSVDEALQTDRGLRVDRRAPDERSIPVSSIQGVALASHPWDAMIAKTKAAPVVEPLAARVPHDVLYVHFHDIRAAIGVAEDVWSWLTPLAQTLENNPGDQRLGPRYETMLLLERTALAKTLGHTVVRGVAMVADDPYLRDGASVGVLFHASSVGAVTAHLDAIKATARLANATTTTYTVRKHTVTLTRAASHQGYPVEQHRAVAGEVVVVTNSRPLMERILAVGDGKAPSLATSGDFRYMRTRYPFSTTNEAGFLFVGDAFVAKTVGPRSKILQSRRVRARGDLMALGAASLMHGAFEGRPPTDLRALLASGFAVEADTTHDDGQPIALDPQRGARSAWGTLTHMVALDRLPLDKVSMAERDAYTDFKRTYQSNWSKWIDPIAVRIRRDAAGKQLALDALMLPLIESSIYNDLIREVGSVTFRPGDVPGAVQWTVALSPNGELDKLLPSAAPGIGDWAVVGALGNGRLWDVAARAGEINAKNANGLYERWLGKLRDAPLYAALHVPSPLMRAALLRDVEKMAGTLRIGWRKAFTHRGATVFVATTTMDNMFERRKKTPLRAFIAEAGDAVVASLDEHTMRWVIERAIDGNLAADGKVATSTAAAAPRQAEFRIQPVAGGWLERTLLAVAESSARGAFAPAYADVETLFRGLGATPAAGYEAAALGFLGYVPESAQGGRFTLDARGRVSHSAFGPREAPLFRPLPSKAGRLTQLVRGLKLLQAGLSFEGAGAERGLRVRLTWTRR